MLDTLVKYFFHPALEKRAEGIVKLFENQIPEKSRILDLGGGWGFYAEPMEKRGHQLVVLDVVKPGYQKAPVVLYEGEKIPFGNNSFDVTFLMTMLHHVPDPKTLLQEVYRVTRDRVIVVEDLYHHGLGRFWTQCRDRILNFEYMDHPCQFKRREEWIELFQKQGFEYVEGKEFYTWLAGMRILNGIFIFKKKS